MLAAFSRRIIIPSTTSGVILIIATCIAIIMANTSASALYDAIVYFPINTNLFKKLDCLMSFNIYILNIVNNGLMTIFFLNIGLEIKYEILNGTLNSYTRAAFPIVAALGGMAVPAIIYSLLTINTPIFRNGWAIPITTDIAFAISILTLFGSRVPLSLRIFLLTLAIVDDFGATAIITLFYDNEFKLLELILACIIIIIMALMNCYNIHILFLYLLLGGVLWFFTLLSGLHPALSGIVTGGIIPLKLPVGIISPAYKLKYWLQPWITYLIIPLFAFVNSGVPLHWNTTEYFSYLLPLWIMISMVIGKPLGVLLFTTIAVKLKLAILPNGITFYHIAAVAMLCGIGFTMSIFITNLAFGYNNPEKVILAKTGILLGSVISSVLGCLLLVRVTKQQV